MSYKLCQCPIYLISNIFLCFNIPYSYYFFIEELVEIIIKKEFICPYEFSLNNPEENWLLLDSTEILLLNKNLIKKIYESCKELTIDCDYYYNLDYNVKEFIAFQILWYLKNLLIFSYLEKEYEFTNVIMLKKKTNPPFIIEWYKPLLKKNDCLNFLEYFLKKEDNTIIDKNSINIEEQKYLKKKYIDLVYKIINKNYDYSTIIVNSLNLLNGHENIKEIIQSNY